MVGHHQCANLPIGPARVAGTILRACLAGALLLLSAGLAHAERLAEYEYLATDASIDIHAVQQLDGWQREQGQPALGHLDQILWIRMDVPQQAEVLLIGGLWVDHFQVFTVTESGAINSYPSGIDLPVAARPMDHPQFAFPLPVSRGSTVFIQHGPSRYSATYPVQFLTAQEYQLANTREHLGHGLFYGLFLVIVLVSMGIFWAFKDVTYLYFVGYNLGIIGVLSGISGYSLYYLWPETPELQSWVNVLSLGLAIVCVAQFALNLLHVNTRDGYWRRLINIGQIATIASISLYLFTPIPQASQLLTLSLLYMAVMLTALNLAYAFKGDYRALVFLIANAPVAIASIYNAAAMLGWLGGLKPNIHLNFIGAALEIMILSVLLLDRMAKMYRQAQEANIRTRELSAEVRQLQASTSLANEHRELQKSIQQTQKLKSIGQLTGGVAHDFNNILASILGFTELALDKGPNISASDRIRYLQEIQVAGQRGADLVKQLMIYSRGGSSQASEINLNETLREASQLLRGSIPTTVRFHTQLPEETITCHLDPVLLQQTLVNLVLNACEAMQHRGEVWIKLISRRVDDTTCSSCLTRFSGDFALIHIEDSGPGLQVNVHDLFNPFHTSKPVGEGSGLGLSVVHGIVHEHNGHVHLADRAPQGARATIFLPQRLVSESVAKINERILLVVQDESLCAYLDELFTSHGYIVTAKSQAHQALESFVENPNAIDLVISDQLDTSTDGADLATEMRRLRQDLPFVLTTNNNDELNAQQQMKNGISAVFEKPIKANLLLAKVRGLLSA